MSYKEQISLKKWIAELYLDKIEAKSRNVNN